MNDTWNEGTASAGARPSATATDARGVAVIAGAVGLAAGAIGTAVVVNAPRIRQWWNARAIPVIHSAQRTVLRRDDPTDPAVDASVILTRSTLRAFSRRVDVAVTRSRTDAATVGAADLVDLLLAASIIADRMRTRSEDDLTAEEHLPELTAAMERLASDPVVDAVNGALSVGGGPVAAETRAIFSHVFDGGHLHDGRYVPVRIDRVAAALRVSRSAIPLSYRTDGAPGDTRHRH